MSKFIAAIDQGTSSTRCIIFDAGGKIVALDQKEHTQIYPKAGWVEHDPIEIWNNTQSVIQNAVEKSRINPAELLAFGITNQRETTVIWDRKTGLPYYNAIVWQDTRTDEICRKIGGETGQGRFKEKVGLPLATYFSGPKIKWLLDYDPEIREAANRGDAIFGTMDTWVVWQLTGGASGGIHVTDVTNASRTMLMNLKTLQWDPDMLEIFGIPPQMLPTICPSSSIFGQTRIPPQGVPIGGILGDQQAALFGQVCIHPGEVKNTYGTGCFMLMNTGAEPVFSRNGLLTTLGYQVGNHPPVYCLEGSIAVAGDLVQWLRDNLNLIHQSSEIEDLAKSVEDNGGIYIVPAFSGLFAPYWRSDARGIIVGLTRFIHKGHIARAVLEATAYQTREVMEAMEADSGIKISKLKVDGGMVVNNLLMQFQADILNVPVVRPEILETTALGSAYAAGLAVGLWADELELRQKWHSAYEWQPAMNELDRQTLYSAWKKAVTKSFNWVN